jgi:hypothetical protein
MFNLFHLLQLHILCTSMMCSFPQSGCTLKMCFHKVEAPLGNHRVVAHRRCVSAKRLHIFNVFPQSGCTSSMCFRKAVAHLRCSTPLGLHIICTSEMCSFPQSGCTSKMCYPFGCTSYAHQRCVPQRGRASEAEGAAHHRCVPFRQAEALAHQRCTSASEAAAHLMHIFDLGVKGLHIKDVQVQKEKGSCIPISIHFQPPLSNNQPFTGPEEPYIHHIRDVRVKIVSG